MLQLKKQNAVFASKLLLSDVPLIHNKLSSFSIVKSNLMGYGKKAGNHQY